MAVPDALDSGHILTDEDVDVARLIREINDALGQPTDELTSQVADTPLERVVRIITRDDWQSSREASSELIPELAEYSEIGVPPAPESQRPRGKAAAKYTSRGETRRQAAIMLTVFTLAVLNLLIFPGTFSLAVLVASTYMMAFRLIVSSKYGWNGPAVSARIMMNERLADIIKCISLKPELTNMSSGDRLTLMTASPETLARAQRADSAAGHVYKAPPSRTTTILIDTLTAIAGVLVGLFVLPPLVPDVGQLCQLRPFQWLIFLSALMLVSLVTALVPLLINITRIRRYKSIWQHANADDVGSTLQSWNANYPETAEALNAELRRVAAVCRSNPIDAYELMTLLGVSQRSLDGRASWYERLALTPGAELVLTQIVFILSTLAALILPPLLGFNCAVVLD
jgi:hypothetical protein